MEQAKRATVRWEWLGEGWQLFSAQWLNWVLLTLVAFSMSLVISLPLYGVMMFAVLSGTTPEELAAGPPAIFWLVYPFIYILGALLGALLYGGIFRAAFKQLRGQQISAGDLFSGIDCVVPMALAVFLVGVLASLGSFACVLPGLVVIGLLVFVFPLVAAGERSALAAISRSFAATKGQWLMFTLFALTLYVIMAAGVLACGVGMLATLPWAILTLAVAYRDVFGLPGAVAVPSASNWDVHGQAAYNQQSWANQTPTVPPAPYTAVPSPIQPQGAPQPAAPTSASTNTSCPRCQAALPNTTKFCTNCGQMLG